MYDNEVILDEVSGLLWIPVLNEGTETCSPHHGQQDPAVAAVTTRSYVVMVQALSCCGHDDQISTNSVTRNSVWTLSSAGWMTSPLASQSFGTRE